MHAAAQQIKSFSAPQQNIRKPLGNQPFVVTRT
jgi:hypothetical protein